MKKVLRIAAAAITIMAMMAGSAYASHVFNDVPDNKFYAVPAEWAADNGITLGCGNGNFCPNRDVTRGENITFAHRYDQNVVQPSLGNVIFRESGELSNWNGELQRLSVTLDAPQDGFAIVTYNVNAGHDWTVSPVGASPTRGTAQIYLNLGSSFVAEEHQTWENPSIASWNDASWTVHAVVPVNAGVNVLTGIVTATETSNLYGQQITVLFVPNGDGSTTGFD